MSVNVHRQDESIKAHDRKCVIDHSRKCNPATMSQETLDDKNHMLTATIIYFKSKKLNSSVVMTTDHDITGLS